MPAAALSDGCPPEWEFRVVRFEDGDARKVTGEVLPRLGEAEHRSFPEQCHREPDQPDGEPDEGEVRAHHGTTTGR